MVSALKTCQRFVEHVNVYNSSFPFRVSFFILFLCWGDHVGFFCLWVFFIFF